jgi:hypothetical protein
MHSQAPPSAELHVDPAGHRSAREARSNDRVDERGSAQVIELRPRFVTRPRTVGHVDASRVFAQKGARSNEARSNDRNDVCWSARVSELRARGVMRLHTPEPAHAQ